jgi:pseudaminic acid biosynthesis-associated methylase
MQKTHQRKIWEDKFGADYIARNIYSPIELDDFYDNVYGYSRIKMNEKFLQNIPKDAKILEVGTNVGNQLLHLQNMGFTNLYGVEIQQRAVNYSKNRADALNIIQGDALDIPFKDNFFDLVFTSGVLIHISPDNINSAIKEIARVSKNYIWGFEYYADTYTEVQYQGQMNLMWKTDFRKLYLDNIDNLKEVKEEKYKYLKDANLEDQMFLLQKA